jgi:aryl-alcohol dehydrogenase-like predicted oxidoreductase
VLRDAVEIGINFFDTAESYGPFVNEELVGEALAPVRDQVVIATKLGWRIEDGKSVGLDSSPARIKQVADESLRRLGVETLDLFYQHMCQRARRYSALITVPAGSKPAADAVKRISPGPVRRTIATSRPS